MKNTPHDPRDWPNRRRTCLRGINGAQVQLNKAIMDGFQLFFFFFFLLNHWPIVYVVLHFCFSRYLSFVFGLFLLFHFFTRTSSISLFNLYAHLGKYVHIFIRTMHVIRLLYPSLSLLSVGHKTGTPRDQVKNTLATTELFRGFGTLILPRAGLSHPN